MIAASPDAATTAASTAATTAAKWEDDGGTVAAAKPPVPAQPRPVQAPQRPATSSSEPAMAAAAPAAVPCASPDASPQEVWAAVLAAAADNERLSAQLAKLTLEALSPQRAIIGHGARNKITAELALPQVQQLLARVLGRSVPVVLQQTAGADEPRLVRPPLDGAPSGAPGVEPPPPARAGPTPEVLAQVNHPLVIKAIELLGATVREVRTRQD